MKPDQNVAKNFALSTARKYENTQNIFQKAFVAVQCNCALCATDLVIKVEPTATGEIREEAYCPSCDMRMRAKTHTLQ